MLEPNLERLDGVALYIFLAAKQRSLETFLLRIQECQYIHMTLVLIMYATYQSTALFPACLHWKLVLTCRGNFMCSDPN